MGLLDQEKKPLQMLDIFVYSQDRGLSLHKAVVLGFIDTSGGGWVTYRDLYDLENPVSSIRKKPNEVSWKKRTDNIWLPNELLNRKRSTNLLKIGKWQPNKEIVEQIQCPELVDIILAALNP